MLKKYVVYLSVFILIFIGSAIGSANEQPQTSPPEAVRLGENLYRIGRVQVDTEKREVTVRGWVNMNAGVIEYLACCARGKLHESLLVLDAKPMHFQVALILIGLEPRGDFEFQGDPRSPKGDPVELWVQWEENEQTKHVRAEQMILDIRTQKPMQETHWIFTGSMIYQGTFLAEVERSLIATYHDPAAIINNPLPEGADDTVYGVNPDLVPRRGTSITLTIKAVEELKKNSSLPPEAGALMEEFEDGEKRVLFEEDFDNGELDPSRWEVTRDGDFNQFAVNVKNESGDNHRLCLMADTLETSDPVKYLGVRSREPVALSQPMEVSFDLDWNDQQNGCYLTAGLYICPLETENPKKEKDWIKFEWTGVPPGKNIRTDVWANVNGAIKQLYTDWGPEDENGRPQGWPLETGSHRIKLLLNGKGIRVWADSKQLCYALHSLNFTSGYLYLQMSSDTNYPAREIYFDNVAVTAIGIR